MVISSTKHKIPTRVYSPFTFVLSENVFCQGVIVLLNPVCVLLSVECFMFIRATYCCSFRDLMTSKTLASIDWKSYCLDLYF